MYLHAQRSLEQNDVHCVNSPRWPLVLFHIMLFPLFYIATRRIPIVALTVHSAVGDLRGLL